MSELIYGLINKTSRILILWQQKRHDANVLAEGPAAQKAECGRGRGRGPAATPGRGLWQAPCLSVALCFGFLFKQLWRAS